MRKYICFVHGLGLHLLGACGFIYFLAIAAGVLTGLANNRPIGLNISVGLICGSLCIYFLLPKTTPDWLRDPVSPMEAFAVLFSLVVALIFVLGPMAGVAVAAFEPPVEMIQMHMALALVPAAIVSLAIAASAFTLAFLPAPEPGQKDEMVEEVEDDDWLAVEDLASDNNIPALASVRMMRLSRT
ncbi:hypothetical protein [Tropicimonas marinistellae]|uniref:hypothetical protein n=1 Tax=Tropicimonas marinistellae TaxID=1739787 RepID=UPI00082B265E|nr:hypothetical protein [Tropicimonas marinistellae]